MCFTCSQYLTDVQCPIDSQSSPRSAVVDWLLNYAVGLEYQDQGRASLARLFETGYIQSNASFCCLQLPSTMQLPQHSESRKPQSSQVLFMSTCMKMVTRPLLLSIAFLTCYQFTLHLWVFEQMHIYPISAHQHVLLLTQYWLTVTESATVLHCSGRRRSGASDATIIQQTQSHAIVCTASRAAAGEAAYLLQCSHGTSRMCNMKNLQAYQR